MCEWPSDLVYKGRKEANAEASNHYSGTSWKPATEHKEGGKLKV